MTLFDFIDPPDEEESDAGAGRRIEVRTIGPDAYWIPSWLNRAQQRWIVNEARTWGRGPVPWHSPIVRGHPMSVKMLCLGWHWRPYGYSRRAIDVNDRRVLDLPSWLVRMGQQAIADTGAGTAAPPYVPDVALINFYDVDARMGLHRDQDEHTVDPIVSVSIGDSATFRLGTPERRGRPYRDVLLGSGDLIVFGGASRLAYHAITKIHPHTAPADCGLATGRVNLTLRVTGLMGKEP